MACECLTNCKADITAKISRNLTLITELNTLGVTSDISKIYTYLFDDIGRLRSLERRMEEMSTLVSCESSVSSTNYMSDSVTYGITTELTAIKSSNLTEYESLSTLFDIVISDPESNTQE